MKKKNRKYLYLKGAVVVVVVRQQGLHTRRMSPWGGL